MVKFFEGNDPDTHQSFQEWRKKNVNGFHLNEVSRGRFVMHYSQDARENPDGRGCMHQGTSSIRYKDDKDGCYTAKRKVCSNSFSELIEWVRAKGFSVTACKHCNSRRFPFPSDSTSESASRAFVLCWNPTRWQWPNYEKVVEKSAKGKNINEPWGTGRSKKIVRGQRVFLYHQSSNRGIIGSGTTVSDTYTAPAWDGSNKKSPAIEIAFDRLLSPENVLPVESLIKRLPKFPWKRLQASGVSLPETLVSKLETLWREHLRGLGGIVQPDELKTPSLYSEGAVRSITVNSYERDKDARDACLLHYGYHCHVCGFRFDKFYGEIGVKFIHVHHLKNLAMIGERYSVDPIKDLRPVCPNCHAMLHTETPAMSIEKLKKIIAAQQKALAKAKV